MRRFYQAFPVAILLLFNTVSDAQVIKDSTPVSVNVNLQDIFNSKVPKEYTISNLSVTGSKSFDANLIISIAGLAVGDKVVIPGGDNFSKAIASLWKQNLISDVQIFITTLQDKNISVEINISERPRLSAFNFAGIKKGQQDDLKTKSGLVLGRVVTDNMEISAVEAIKKYYVDKGYRNVTVSIREIKTPSVANSVSITFDIDKGQKALVSEIMFAGNDNVRDSKLKKQMKGTKEKGRFTVHPPKAINPYDSTKSTQLSFHRYIIENDYLYPSKTKELLDPYIRFKLSSSKFNDKKYAEDKDHILNYYNSLGYRDAQITSDTQLYKNGNVDVALKIKEGHKYYFGNITWRGNTKYSDSVLSLLLGIKKGDTYNIDILNKKLGKQLSQEGGDISSLYMDDGYLFFRIDPVETAVYNDTIDHEIRLVEGPQATIGKVGIVGNEKTKEHVIRRELRTIPGEKFSRSDLIRTQRELSQLGFFNPEKVLPNVVPNADDGTVDITWSVEEKSSDQLELSAGFGGGIGVTGTLGVTFNNFSINNIFKKTSWAPLPSGDGQKLSLRVQSNGRAYRSYNFSFTEPWLGGKKRNSLTVSYYNTKYANSTSPLTGLYDKSYADSSYIKTTGFSVSLGKQLKWPDDYFALIYSFNFQQYYLKNYTIFAGLKNGVSDNFSLKVTLARNSAGPSPIYPTSGSNFLFSVQLTPPYSLFRNASYYADSSKRYNFIEFHKERFTAEWYVPIGKAAGPEKNRQMVLKVAAKYGYIGSYSSITGISPFERFQLGDAGLSNNFALLGYDIISHRGYPVYDNSDPKINPDISTASQFFTIFNKYTMELRYPLSTGASSTIYAEGFFEAANGWYTFQDYNPFKLRRSVGLGMRFFLPMFGLLGFDYGIGLDRINPASSLKDASKFTFMLGVEPE